MTARYYRWRLFPVCAVLICECPQTVLVPSLLTAVIAPTSFCIATSTTYDTLRSGFEVVRLPSSFTISTCITTS
ncbi:hypothetical protein AGIG_G12679 [Arapaima gigas]